MATSHSAWGIDLGNRALKAIKLVQDGDQLRIDDVEVIEHEMILSAAGDNRESTIQKAIANFAQRHDLGSTPVAIGVNGQSSFARFIKLPPVEPKRIPEIVKFEAIQQIPFKLEDVEWSYQLFQEQDSPDIEVGIFAMRKELVAKQISYFSDLKLNVQTVQMNPLAIYNAMFHDQRIDGTTLFVDAGAEATDLIISDGQTVWLRSLPTGGNNFTETLAKAFKLNFAKAEDLKRNAATSKYARQIFQTMRPVFADLVSEIQRSIGFYASTHRDARINKIVALGGTFRLPALQKYLEQNLQLKVERCDSFRASSPSDGRLATIFTENAISLAGAYGLALQAMGEAQVVSSLLPETIRRTKMWQQKTKWFAAAAAAIVVGVAGMGGRYLAEKGSFDSPSNQSARQHIQDVKTLAQRYSNDYKQKVESAGQADRDKILAVGSLKQYRELWPTLIGDLFASLPDPTAGVPQNPSATRPSDVLKAIPRPERKQIMVDSIISEYKPDISSIIDETKTTKEDFAKLVVQTTPGGAGAGAGAMGMGGGAGMYGDPSMARPNPTFGPGGSFGAPAGSFGAPAGSFGGMPTDPSGAVGGMPGVDVVAKRGFLIKIAGTTPRPYKDSIGAQFIAATLEAALKAKTEANAIAAGRPYYIARVAIVKVGQRHKPDVAPGAAPAYIPTPMGMPAPQRYIPPASGAGSFGGARGGLGGMGAGGVIPGVAGGIVPPPAPDPNADPLMPGESIENDTEFELLLAVVLDPQKPQADANAMAVGQ